MAHEISLALESHQLRMRELKMLVHLQQTHWWSDLEADLSGVLTRTVAALEADGGAFLIDAPQPGARALEIRVGAPAGESESLLRSLANSSREMGQMLDIQALEQEGGAVRSLLAVPLRHDGKPTGTLLLWSARTAVFGSRQQQLASVVAGQAALLVENQRLSLQVEDQAALAERARLAREIHDGLAQTLAYLKLRMSQMVRNVADGAPQRLEQELKEMHRLLAEAYVDAREAIDGLYLATAAAGLEAWVEELADDFARLSGVPVTVEGPDVRLAPEATVQLQRIVQEALSNVRKHAGARSVRVVWWLDEDEALAISIRDDGRGFDSAATSEAITHGLRTMQERAALLGAELQVTSSPGQGTDIQLRMPVPTGAEKQGVDDAH